MEHIRGNSYYLPSQVVIGGYKVDDTLILFDSGNDDSSARKAIRDFDEINVIAVFNTHSHADHCGGNQYLQRQFSAAVYAPVIENAFIEAPILEPTYLYGAYPMKPLQNKFLMARPSKVMHLIEDESPIAITINGVDHMIKPISLSGHSPNQYGYITPDGIAYLGDALIAEEMVDKHPLIFTYDVTEHYQSLEKLKTLTASGYVIAHGGFYESIEGLIHANIEALDLTQNLIKQKISQGTCTFDELHKHLADTVDLHENLGQNLLNRSVIKAHVRHLVDLGLMTLEVINGMIYIKENQIL